MATEKQIAHCRRIASLGGKAVVAKHGRDHMRRIGREGFERTNALHYSDYGACVSHLVKLGHMARREGR